MGRNRDCLCPPRRRVTNAKLQAGTNSCPLDAPQRMAAVLDLGLIKDRRGADWDSGIYAWRDRGDQDVKLNVFLSSSLDY